MLPRVPRDPFMCWDLHSYPDCVQHARFCRVLPLPQHPQRTGGWPCLGPRRHGVRPHCLIWPPACVSGYLGGAPKRGSTRYHTSAASSTGGDIKMLQRRIAGALTRCKSKPAGPWPYAPHHSHSTCSNHHSHHEHAACTSERGDGEDVKPRKQMVRMSQ